jgi:hypothetical protein
VSPTLQNVLISLTTSVIGGLITGGVFYWFSGRQLRGEANRLRELNSMILRAMEVANLVQVNRDSHGNPIGFILTASGGIVGSSGVKGNLTVMKPPTPGD